MKMASTMIMILMAIVTLMGFFEASLLLLLFYLERFWNNARKRRRQTIGNDVPGVLIFQGVFHSFPRVTHMKFCLVVTARSIRD